MLKRLRGLSAVTVTFGVAAYVMALVALAPASPAWGESSDWNQCKDVNHEDTIDRGLAACNRILKDRRQAKYHAMALRNRCGLWYTKGSYDRALEDCNEALRMEPRSTIGHDRRGRIWYRKGNHDRAIADFDEAIELDSNNAYAYLHRSLAWEAKGNHDRAKADKAKALRLDPKLDD